MKYNISETEYIIKISNQSDKNTVWFTTQTKPSAQKDSSWNFIFSAPKGTPLSVGVYNNVERHAFVSEKNPGMEISGDSRGSNKLGGWFTVLEIKWDPTTGEVIQAAIDFCQLSENDPQSWTKGSIRYNSLVP